MSSKEHPVTMEKLLPGDVLTDIFSRLPAKLVAQMRTLSKPFNALLSKPSFIKSHLHRSINNNDEILLVFHSTFSFDHEPFTAHPSRSPHLEYTNFIKLPNNIPFSLLKSSSVIGSVNGLICFIYIDNDSFSLMESSDVVHIWNPSLSALLPLPPYNITPKSRAKKLFRFGFDPKTDDYKVVKLTFLLQQFNNKDPFFAMVFGSFLPEFAEWLPVEVYSTKKGCWEIITQRFPTHVTWIVDQDDELYVDGLDGHLHWLGYIDGDREQQTIVSFDLNLETFGEISLPVSSVSRRNSLTVLDGKLSLMSCIADCDFEVWVLTAKLWTKHHVFSQFPGYIAPFGFTLNNEFLFEADNCCLELYDPVEAKVRSFKTMARLASNPSMTKVAHYIDSLVWVEPIEREIGSCDMSSLQI